MSILNQKTVNSKISVSGIGLHSGKNVNLNILVKDYYFSNVIARSSKTMLDCKNAKMNIKRTGTEG